MEYADVDALGELSQVTHGDGPRDVRDRALAKFQPVKCTCDRRSKPSATRAEVGAVDQNLDRSRSKVACRPAPSRRPSSRALCQPTLRVVVVMGLTARSIAVPIA
jgi:hypothetical protein